eukprot:COSAG01_NODE_14087_length_1497_cov_8.035765_2_plen_301_part_00
MRRCASQGLAALFCAVSAIIAPINFALGSLYVEAVDNSTLGVGNATTDASALANDGDICQAVGWSTVYAYYLIGGAFNVAGFFAYVFLTRCTRSGAGKLVEKDLQLQRESSEDHGGGGAEAKEGASSTPLLSIWMRCGVTGFTMVLSLCENLLVCSQYDALRTRGELPGLSTLMMYSFYAAQCVGAITVMSHRVQVVLQSKVLLFLALVRVPGVVMIFVYNDTPDCDFAEGKGLFGSDWEILIFYFVYMWIGGMTFSQCFSISGALFQLTTDKIVSATVMNVLYFAAVVCVSVAVIVQHT